MIVSSLLNLTYLFASEINFITCPVNQLLIFRRPSFTPTQITYTTNLQPIHSISINLHSRWRHYKQLRSHNSLTWLPASNPCGHYKNFLLFIFCLWLKVWFCQAVALHCMLPYQYFTFLTPFRDQLNRLYFPLSAAHRVLNLKISRVLISSLSLEVSWMDFTVKFLTDRQQLRASNPFTWLTNVPEMFSYRVGCILVVVDCLLLQ